MSENEKPLELLKLLNLDGSDPVNERLLRWEEAFEAWMEERQTQVTPTTAESSHIAWREFLAVTGKPPWEATAADVEAYIQALQKRKLRPATVKNRLGRLSRFYEYCQKQRIDPECEAGFNPVAGARRPKVKDYEKANYLSRKEEAALLESLRRDPSPTGKRDYALFLMLLRTGWRASVVRELKWEELRDREGGDKGVATAAENAAWEPGCMGAGERRRKTLLGSKGKEDKGGQTEEVWQAVREYLEASGRWEGIQPEEYVFAPSREPMIREAREQPQDWDGSRPLSRFALLIRLKQNAGRAGLKAEKITTRTLQHTTVMRQVEAGATAEAVRAKRETKRLRSVKAYLGRLAEKPKGRLRAPKQVDPATGELVSPGSEEIPSHAPSHAQPGNHRGLKHGFYAKYLPEFEWLEEQGIELHGMDRAIMRWRIVMRRIMIVGYDVQTLDEALRYLKLMGLASVRLVKALRHKQMLQDLQMELRWKAFFRRE